MGLSRSLTIGASSLRSHQSRFDVISNNIANVNTYGFKSGRANFADQFSQLYNLGRGPDSTNVPYSGGMNPLQFGLGVKIGSVTPNMSQGALETTGRPLDMALQGDGYFIFNYNGRESFSRAGAISRDKDGNLVDSSTGAFLKGYNIDTDENGRIVKTSGKPALRKDVGNLQIKSNLISEPRQTQNISLSGNLSADTSANPNVRETTITIFDEVGGSHSLTITFTQQTTPNTYTISAKLDNNDVTVDPTKTTLTFNNDGTLDTTKSASSITIKAADLNTALGGKKLFDDDAVNPKNLTLKLVDSSNLSTGITQFSGASTATATEQDGYSSGSLSDLSVDSEGKIWGSFTNGVSEVVAQVAIAKFTNPAALVKNGNNMFTVSPNSGLPNIGTAGFTFPSTSIAGGALEQSNVDLTEQFTDMISTQRAYESAARTITVSDQMLAEVNQLKR